MDALRLLGEANTQKKDLKSALANFRLAAKLAPKNSAVAAGFGLTLLAVDSVDAAILQISRAIESAPDKTTQDVAALYDALGDAYMKQGVNVLGITNYQKAVELSEKNIEARFKLARAYEKDKKYNDAVKEYGAVQSIDSTFADAYYQQGRIFFLAKMFKNAISPLRRFIGLRPKSFDGASMLAKTYSAANMDSEAVKIAWKALQIDSSGAETWRVYFYSLVETRDFKNAEPALKSLQKRGQLVVEDYLKLGKLYKGLNRDDDALAWLEKASQADTANCDPYFDLGSLYMKKQDYAKAAAMFEKKISCDPKSLSALLNAGASYMQVKNFARSRELFMRSIELRHDFYQGRLWLARYYSQVDSLDFAKAQYDTVLMQIGDKPERRKDAGEAHGLIGTYYFLKQQYGRAVQSYRDALAFGNVTGSINLSLGQAVLQTIDRQAPQEENRRKIEDAVRAFRKCIDLEPSNGQGHLWLGQGLILLRVEGDNAGNKKLTEEACSEFKKALRIEPRNDDAKKAMERYGCQ